MLANEISHARNRDILIGSVAAAVALGITFLARMLMWGAMFGGHGWRNGRDRNGNFLGVHRDDVLGPVGRGRSCRWRSPARVVRGPDRSGAELVGTGEPLARALEKIDAYAQQIPMNVDPADADGLHHQPAHREAGELREPLPVAPADRGAHRAVAAPARAHADPTLHPYPPS